MKLSRLVILVAAAAIVVFPAGVALADPPPVNPVRDLPDTVERGGTFNVTVNFTATGDNFGPITVTDYFPAGWNATVNTAWSTPPASHKGLNIVEYVEISWKSKLYDNGTNFTARYKVTVPCNASLTNYPFDEGNISTVAYYCGGENTSHIFEPITGDSNVTVDWPAICSPMSIDFYAAPNGTNPPNQTLEVWSSTPCWINNWTITEIDAAWLKASPPNGSCNYTEHSFVNLSANTSGMDELQNYTANITIESLEANNSPLIVPVTLHITDKGILKGQASFCRAANPGDPTWETPLVVRFFDNSTKVEMDGSPINITTDAYGDFTVGGIVPGSYDIGIKNFTSLSELVANVTMNAGALTEVDFGVLLEGDANNDDYISGGDYSRLSAAWMSYPGLENWNPNVDFNRDRYISGGDYSLLSSSWLQYGDMIGP